MKKEIHQPGKNEQRDEKPEDVPTAISFRSDGRGVDHLAGVAKVRARRAGIFQGCVMRLNWPGRRVLDNSRIRFKRQVGEESGFSRH